MSNFEYPDYFNLDYVGNSYSNPEKDRRDLSNLRRRFLGQVEYALKNRKDEIEFDIVVMIDDTEYNVSDNCMKLFVTEIVEKFWNKSSPDSNIYLKRHNYTFKPDTYYESHRWEKIIFKFNR